MKKRMIGALFALLMSSGLLVAQKKEQESLPAGYQRAFGPGKTGTWKEVASDNFFMAIASGNIDAAKDIIIEGSRIDEKLGVDIKDAKGNTPLFYAPDLDTVKFLIKNGAKVNAQNNAGLAPLHVHVVMGHTKIVNYLLDHKADSNIRTNKKVTPLHLATMIALLNDEAAWLVKVTGAGAAAEAGVGAFLGAGAGVAAADVLAGVLEVEVAAEMAAAGAVAGAVVGAAAAAAATVAIIAGEVAVIDIALRNAIMLSLLKHGARADVQDADGNTPLHTLANGKIVKTKDKLRRGGVIMAEQLLAWGNVRGINLRDIKNNDGMTPYDVAMKNGRLLLAPLLDPRLPRPFEKGIKKLMDMAVPDVEEGRMSMPEKNGPKPVAPNQPKMEEGRMYIQPVRTNGSESDLAD